jgi:hypothetical protein
MKPSVDERGERANTRVAETIETKRKRSGRRAVNLPAGDLQRIPPMFETIGNTERIAEDFCVRRADATDKVMQFVIRELRRLQADVYGGPRDPSPAGRVIQMRRAA